MKNKYIISFFVSFDGHKWYMYISWKSAHAFNAESSLNKLNLNSTMPYNCVRACVCARAFQQVPHRKKKIWSAVILKMDLYCLFFLLSNRAYIWTNILKLIGVNIHRKLRSQSINLQRKYSHFVFIYIISQPTVCSDFTQCLSVCVRVGW